MEHITFISRYAKRYWPALAAAILSTILLVLTNLAAPQMVRELIAQVKSAAVGEGDVDFITKLAVTLLVLYILRGGFTFGKSYLAHIAGWGVVADTRRDVYEHLQAQNLRFYEDRQTGELMSRTVNDTDKFEHLVAHAMPDTLVNILTLIGVLMVLLSMNTKLMLLTLIPIPLVFLAIRLFAKYVRPAFHRRQEDLAELNANLQDNLSGMREIQAFCQEEAEAQTIWQKIIRFKNSNLRALRLMATFRPVIEFTSSLGTVIVIYFGGRLAFNQVLPLEDLVAFFLYLEMFYQPIRALGAAWEHTQEAVVGSERVKSLLDMTPEIRDKRGARPFPGPVNGKIEFREVSFSYIEDTEVLKNINLTLQPKTVTALVGPTGVGKTTLAGLIPRFYDVIDGKVLFDGQDIRKIKIRDLREKVSIVLQDVFLFNGTLRQNILFGRGDASEEEMIEAAKTANALSFISTLDQGYSTIIGERGIKLSGGQKQRISIARAVLKGAPILILDEATSSVDTQTETLIQEALERLMQGRTTLVIAHRLSTIRKADQIVVLEEGRIREIGTHQQLIEEEGLYHRLTQVQNLV